METKMKRGQAAAGAAVLIAIIAGLIIMFIILIPPQERAVLLDDNTPEGGTKTSDKVLLDVSPGRIDFLSQNEVEHPLPVVNVFTREESKVLAEKNIAEAKKGIFSEETSEFTFSISDLENTQNILLAFNIEKLSGRLIVELNGERIYNSETSLGSIKPIDLHKNSLKNKNTLVFKVSSPGIVFWASNEVFLRDIKVIADVTSLEAQSSQNIFLVSETEKDNLEKVFLNFKPECELNEANPLIININGKNIFNTIPDCNLDLITIEFSAETINQGENKISFQTLSGTYQLSHIVIRSELKGLDFPTYYFDLTHEQYQKVKDGSLIVRLQMDFVDMVDENKGDLIFNGHAKNFETKDLSYKLDLSDEIVQGSNALKIKPKKTLEVRKLKVDLVN